MSPLASRLLLDVLDRTQTCRSAWNVEISKVELDSKYLKIVLTGLSSPQRLFWSLQLVFARPQTHRRPLIELTKQKRSHWTAHNPQTSKAQTAELSNHNHELTAKTISPSKKTRPCFLALIRMPTTFALLNIWNSKSNDLVTATFFFWN